MKNIRNIVLLFFGIFLISGVLLNSQLDSYNFEYDMYNIEDSYIGISGLQKNGQEYIVINDDPQMIIDLSSINNSDGIEVIFRQNIVGEKVRIYFADSIKEFSEDMSTLVVVDDENKISFIAPYEVKYIRVDIDNDFSLKEVKAITNYSVNKIYNVKFIFIVLAISIVGSTLLSLNKFVKSKLDNLFLALINKIKALYFNIKKVLLYIGILFLIVISSIGLEKIYTIIKDKGYYNKYRVYTFIAIGIILLLVVSYKKILKGKIENLFLFIVLIIGTLNIVASPPSAGISWDDQIHYRKTVYLANIFDETINMADQILVSKNSYSHLEKKDYYHSDREEWTNYINGVSNRYKNEIKFDREDINHVYVSYLPASIGIILGKGLELSFTHTFMLGKLMNLVAYSLIVYYAIKSMRYGKLIVAAIALIPTVLLSATTYSYDAWVIAFIMLGYAKLIGTIQNDEKITLKKWISILFVLIIGILPKAIYFLLILPMLFLPSGYFEEKLSISKRWLSGVIAMLILVATFIIPIIVGSGGDGDIRGGSGVSSSGQISFILNNPLEYSKILLGFLKEYISLDNMKKFITDMAYYGQGYGHTLIILTIMLVSIVDKEDKLIKYDKNIKYIKLMQGLCSFATVVLIPTALYISFTPVGNFTILGCQSRYIIPILFPLIYFISDIKIECKLNRRLLEVGSMLVMSFVFILNIYKMCIGYF